MSDAAFVRIALAVLGFVVVAVFRARKHADPGPTTIAASHRDPVYLGPDEYVRRVSAFTRWAHEHGLVVADDGARISGTIDGASVLVSSGLEAGHAVPWFVQITFPYPLVASSPSALDHTLALLRTHHRVLRDSVFVGFDSHIAPSDLTFVERIIQDADQDRLAAARNHSGDSPYRN